MKNFPEIIKLWDTFKKKGMKLPVKFSVSTMMYLSHTDKQKDKFEKYCYLNNIKFEVR